MFKNCLLTETGHQRSYIFKLGVTISNCIYKMFQLLYACTNKKTIYLFFQKILIIQLLCIRHSSRCWQLAVNWIPTVPALAESTVNWEI